MAATMIPCIRRHYGRQTAAPLVTMMALNPERLQAAGPDRPKTLAFYDQLVAQYRGRDANDYLYQLESSFDYDPGLDVSKIKAPLFAIGFIDDEINPAQLNTTQQIVARLPAGRFQECCQGATPATDTPAYSTGKCGQKS